MEECVQLIMDEVARRGYTNHHTLAYQSRVGPVEWLKPYTDDSIRRVGGARGALATEWVTRRHDGRAGTGLPMGRAVRRTHGRFADSQTPRRTWMSWRPPAVGSDVREEAPGS